MKVGGPDMAPHTQRSSRPGEAGALLDRAPRRYHFIGHS